MRGATSPLYLPPARASIDQPSHGAKLPLTGGEVLLGGEEG